MKMFLSTLAALLVAGSIFIIGFKMRGVYLHWQRQKEDVIRIINQEDGRFDSLHSEFKEQARAGVTLDMQTLSSDEREGLDLLKTILETKPFLPLNAEEKQCLALASQK